MEDVVLFLNSTLDSEVVREPHSRVLIGAAALSLMASLSQVISIIIARGLQGDYSARTLMWVQSASEIVEQLIIVEMTLCGIFDKASVCHHEWHDLSCKLFSYMSLSMIIVTEWLAVLVSMDRMNALQSPVWYRENCTQNKAWILIGPLYLVVFMLVFPRFLGSSLNSGSCRSNYEQYDRVVSLLGVPAVGLGACFTARLVYLLKMKKASSKQSSRESDITVALAISCCVHTVFAGLQYALLFFAFIIAPEQDRVRYIFYMGIAQIVGCVGVTIRGPVYFILKPMREAFWKGVKI